jgi:sugar lactone lactonase YvrE
VAWQLEAAGYTVRIQAWDFGAGSHFVAEMHQTAQAAARTVAVLSAAYLSSAFAQAEWQAAWAQDPAGQARKLLMFRIEDCARPGLLGQLVSVDLFGINRDAAVVRLVAAARRQRGKPAVEPVFPGGLSRPAVVAPGAEPIFPGLPAVGGGADAEPVLHAPQRPGTRGVPSLSMYRALLAGGRGRRHIQVSAVAVTAFVMVIAIIAAVWSHLPSGITTNRRGATQPGAFIPIRLIGSLNSPSGVAVSPDDTLYITDTFNNRILEIDAQGHTSATKENVPPAGVAVDSDGTLYVTNARDNQVLKIDKKGAFGILVGSNDNVRGSSSESGPVIQTRLNNPLGVAVGPRGTVYIADTGNNRILKIDKTGGRIDTFAGSPDGTAGRSGDRGLATQARLDHPSGVAVDPDGTVYIADTNNGVVRKVDATGRIDSLPNLGPGPPLAVAVGPHGVLYTTTATSQITKDGGLASQVQLNDPLGVAVGRDGTVYIADTANNQIQRIDRNGNIDTPIR